ncbi:DUF3396 domain-containing protein [Archangium gephyra]|uniref:type VI immunity family protein n=1 Tax=Archangium gephyra TaxID=48 RepID=UPI0035D43721
MSEHYPRIRIHAENGYLLMREGLSICFYMHSSHQEVVRAVMHSLDVYLGVVGPQSLGWYDIGEGEWQKLDDEGWAVSRRKMLEKFNAHVTLRDALSGECRYGFEYHGHALDMLFPHERLEAGCAVSFLLPTEYLDAHGPGRVRELALELAAPLPFCSGHAGLSFNGETEPLSMSGEAGELCFRYPGLDVPNLDWMSWKLGTRVRGAYWLTFLGQPVLGALGGTAELRSRLSSPDTTVQELEGERVAVTLGRWPEAGDAERGQMLPAYRELARVLEPWTYHEEHIIRPESDARKRRRWERRFLD